ncbi:MAG TPA: hypothetical protein VJ643_05870 [Nitrososphaera sp.]|nr:hypothetical protein [Nitrososphaera sp.]
MIEAKLSVKLREASFSMMRGWRFRFIYRLGMPAASICLTFLLSYVTNNFGNNLFAEAQSSVTTIQDEQNANETIQTFQIDGAVGSLVTDLLNPTMRENVSDSTSPLYVLAGNWSMGVVNGEVNYLEVDFIMALENGTQMQVYSIENLENIVIPSTEQNTGLTSDQELSNNNNLVLSSTNNYSLSLFGYVDVLTDDRLEWQNVPVSIDIFNGNTISILLYPSETDNRFKGQPIYGMVTWILDANNNPIKPSIWTAAT